MQAIAGICRGANGDLRHALKVTALGRFASAGNATQAHTLELIDAATHHQVAAVSVDLSTATGDTNGYAWAALAKPVTLAAGRRLFLLSSETKNGDFFFSQETMVQSASLRGFAGDTYFFSPNMQIFCNDGDDNPAGPG